GDVGMRGGGGRGVQVAAVAQFAGGGHVEGGVLVRAVAVVGRPRRVVDRVDRDAHRGHVAVGLAVVGLVGEGVGAVVVGGRRVGECARAWSRQRAGAWGGGRQRG